METVLPDGTVTKLPKFPLEYGDAEQTVALNPPKIGEHTVSILQESGFSDAQIELFLKNGIVKR